jgi:hypothetical protein
MKIKYRSFLLTYVEVKLQILTFIGWFWWQIERHSSQSSRTVCEENTYALQMVVYWWRLSRWRWSIHFTRQVGKNLLV